VLARSAAIAIQLWPLLSVAVCKRTLLMSVLPFALPTVQVQLVGLSVHLSPPEKIMSLPLYWSMKWKVVRAFKGTPA